MLAGPGEPVSGPLLVELRKLNILVTTQGRASYPHAVHGDPCPAGDAQCPSLYGCFTSRK